jgi:predicted nucleotidyltransferase
LNNILKFGKIGIGDNMFIKYLNNKKLSIHELSKLSNVPYITLKDLISGKLKTDDCEFKIIKNISIALNITIDTLLYYLNNKKVILSTTWEDNKYKIFYFPTVLENLNYDFKRIHPLKQRIINDLYNVIKNIELIEKVILFGSSINIRCNRKSDIDFAIKIKENYFNTSNKNKISEIIQEITNYNSDIIWLNNIDENSTLFFNINQLGVILINK